MKKKTKQKIGIVAGVSAFLFAPIIIERNVNIKGAYSAQSLSTKLFGFPNIIYLKPQNAKWERRNKK